MATQTGSIDLTATNGVHLYAKGGFETAAETYATQADLDIQADRIGMVVANTDASSSLQLTANAMTYIGNHVEIKDSAGTSTVISGGKVAANSISASELTVGVNNSIANGATTATNYITEIAGGGIKVHDANDTSDYAQITSNGMDVYNDGDNVASFGADGAQIGLSGESHVEIDYHSLQLIDKDGGEYLHVSDLRGASGYAELSETFTGDGLSRVYRVFYPVRSAETSAVTVDGDTVQFTVSLYTTYANFTLTETPQSGATVVISYQTNSDRVKAYTFGKRLSGTRLGAYSFCEGEDTTASEDCCHAEGYGTTASYGYSHAEGRNATASGHISHAEGESTTANGAVSHAEGQGTEASGHTSHAEGNHTTASGNYSHAQNRYTVAASDCQTAMGKYNVEDANDVYALIIGNGTADNARSNALAVKWDGAAIMQAWAGVIQMFAGSTPPAGWLLCDGSAVSRTDYATLFAAIGTTWGVGDGSTTFNLPDLRGRAPIGAGTGSGLTARTLGGTLGSEAVQSHTHGKGTLSITSSGGHDHAIQTKWNTAKPGTSSGTIVNLNSSGSSSSSDSGSVSIASNTGAHTHPNSNFSGDTGSYGTGNAGNMQPSAVVNFIIHTGKF